jgi:transcription antitermination factor NusG
MMALDRPRPGFVPIAPALDSLAAESGKRLECGHYSAPWYVALTEWGQERLARGECQQAEIQTFLPLVRKRQQLRDGKVRQVIETAFPGYLFVLIQHPDHWHRMKRARGVAGVLHAVGDRERPAEVQQHIMAGLLAAASPQGILEALSDPPTDLAVIEVGQHVRITTGWLAGMVGTCTWSSAQRVAVLLEAMGQKVTVERRSVEAEP